MDEIVFLRRRSATVIVADLIQPSVITFSKALRVVALLGAPGRPDPEPSIGAPRMAIVVYRPRNYAAGARQGAELELPLRGCSSRRVAAREPIYLPPKVVSMARRLTG